MELGLTIAGLFIAQTGVLMTTIIYLHNRLEKKIDRLEDRLDVLDGRLEIIDRRLSNLEKESA